MQIFYSNPTQISHAHNLTTNEPISISNTLLQSSRHTQLNPAEKKLFMQIFYSNLTQISHAHDLTTNQPISINNTLLQSSQHLQLNPSKKTHLCKFSTVTLHKFPMLIT